MTKPQLNYAASNYVFRLLGRGRARAQRAPGSALEGALATLREGGQSALIEVELASGSLGRLLVQVGRLVFVQHEDKSAEQALAEIRQGIGDAHLYILELSDEQIIFACAALAGIPLALGETLGTDPEQIPALLEQLSKGSFTGVVALEQGLQTLIWRFQRGRVLNTVKLPDRIRAGRLTQIVWQEQMLGEVGGTGAGVPPEHTGAQPQTPVRATSVQASAQPASVRHTMIRNTQVQNTQVQNTQVQAPQMGNTQVQGTRLGNTQVRNTYVQNTQLPSTYVPNTSIHETSVKNPSVRDTSAHNTPLPNTPVQNTSVSQTQYGSGSRQSKRQAVPEGTEEVWAAFQSVIYAQLGSRGERVFGLMYTELGRFPRDELIGRLTGQVERIAGSAAARKFRDRFRA